MPRADVIADRIGKKKRLSEKIKVGFI